MSEKDQMREWLQEHGACVDGYKWAVENCESLKQVWDTARPDWLVWVATREGVLTDRELREFALHCAESVRHLMTDQRSLDALAVVRRYLDGGATDQELSAAAAAADEAADEASAWAAACASADEAAWAAAWAAACASADEAACASADEAAWAAACASAEINQAAWLRKNCKPNFEGVKP